MPKGVYKRKRKKLSKKELKRRARERQLKYQQTLHKSHDVEAIRNAPTRSRDSYITEFGGDFNLNVTVRVGPRLAEEHHGSNWRYWHND